MEREFGADVTVIPNPQGVELSSTEVRQALAQGGGADLLPPAVYGYVLRERLYSTKKTLTGLTPDELRPIALSYLKPKRMPHVLGTEQEAVRLARRYGGDEIQARIAALLHDCTKKLDMPEQLALCYDLLGEYANLDELNYLASKLDDMSQDEYERFQAAMEIGDRSAMAAVMYSSCSRRRSRRAGSSSTPQHSCTVVQV